MVAPSSTLHNWQQEFGKFCPTFNVLPYWGSVKERQILRKGFRRRLGVKEADFHVLITSYRLVVDDEKYLNAIKVVFLILYLSEPLFSLCAFISGNILCLTKRTLSRAPIVSDGSVF